MKEKIKKFNFWKNYIIAFCIILFLLLVLFGFVGSYEDGFTEAFWGILILALILSIILTLIIKWFKDYKTTGKIIDSEKKKPSGDIFMDLFKWKMDEEELKYQAQNYNVLSFGKSIRSGAVILLILSIIINLILIIIGWLPIDIWLDILIILFLTFFIYKGKKWAMIIAMIYWTIAKGLQLIGLFTIETFDIINVVMVLFWWAIISKALWQAYQVERLRHIILQEKRKESEIIYCSKCGNKLDSDSQFCFKCGAKI